MNFSTKSRLKKKEILFLPQKWKAFSCIEENAIMIYVIKTIIFNKIV